MVPVLLPLDDRLLAAPLGPAGCDEEPCCTDLSVGGGADFSTRLWPWWVADFSESASRLTGLDCFSALMAPEPDGPPVPWLYATGINTSGRAHSVTAVSFFIVFSSWIGVEALTMFQSGVSGIVFLAAPILR